MNMKHNISRRDFIGAMAAAPLLRQDGDWVDLFDGKNIDGWRPQRLPEGQTSWKVVDGTLSADGPMCHLFYAGPVRNADFKNFELEVEAMASPNSNSGIYFHTTYQETSWPQKGFEVHVVADAVCSRRKLDWEIGLQWMGKKGAMISTTEIIAFQLLKEAGTEEFKRLSKLLK